MSSLIFEIFSEEMPASLQSDIVFQYILFVKNNLDKIDIKNIGEAFVGITPNRLILSIDNCECDAKRLENFAVLTLTEFAKTFPRTMCYPQLEVRWIRPIRNILLCVDNEIVKADLCGIKTTNGTFVNKFDFVECKNVNDYFNLMKKYNIELDYSKRLEFVKDNIYQENVKVVNEIGARQRNTDEYWHDIINIKYLKLAREIAGMSEYCVPPMKCVLNKEFDVLPFELIELVLRENQRYVVFPKNTNGEIVFLIFGDRITEKEDRRVEIVKGHQKVVKARLEDALYYWCLDADIKKTTGNGYKKHLYNLLSARTFVDDITWGEYLQGQMELTEKAVEDKNIAWNVKQLIMDTKLDLATNVVAEFPELQGIIGKYYFGYDFNPYVLEIGSVLNQQRAILYYYLIDRIVYIEMMYKQGKGATGSGDKYKVKTRMDDIIAIIDGYKSWWNLEHRIIDNEMIKHLLVKRYVKFLERRFSDDANIKKVAPKYVECVLDGKFYDLKMVLNSIKDVEFVKIYRRIIGYTPKTGVEVDDVVINKVGEILNNSDDIVNINTYLDGHKIADDKIAIRALKIIEDKYFAERLPKCFLDLL